MAMNGKWQQASDQVLARELRPRLEEAYGPLPTNEAWLLELVRVIRGAMETVEDGVSWADWALTEEVTLTEEAAAALVDEATRPVLVRLVAELAQVVLLDKATAAHIVQNLQRSFEKEHGWPAGRVEAPIHIALTGRVEGLPLPAVMALLGRERCMNRLATVLR